MKVYGHCKVDLLNSCENLGIDPNKPLNKFSKQESTFLWEGDPSYETQGSGWYGINRFFKWLEKKTYKMHVRVFLAKYRNYFPCPECNGKRLSAEALNWKWGHYDLSELYSLSVNRLLDILPETNNGKSNQRFCLTCDSEEIDIPTRCRPWLFKPRSAIHDT